VCASDLVETKPLPFTSKSPPSCGVESSARLAIPEDVARPATKPPEASTASKTSPEATDDISDKSPTAVGLKFVPSAISKMP